MIVTETEKNGKFSIRIRFDSTRAIFDSILFDLLFKNIKSIRFDSTESTFGFDSIRQEIFSIYSIRFGSLCVRKKMLCILTYFLFFMILSRENESYLSIFSLYTPGQNKRNTLFCLLFLPTIVVWSDIYMTDTYSITRLMLKVSALKNKNWWRKVPIYLMY